MTELGSGEASVACASVLLSSPTKFVPRKLSVPTTLDLISDADITPSALLPATKLLLRFNDPLETEMPPPMRPEELFENVLWMIEALA